MLTHLLLATLITSAAAQLNSNFHRSFWGLAYNPDGVILPDCSPSQAQISQDIYNIAQLTGRVRLYGADCNQTAMVQEAIRETNADLQLWPTIYISVPYNATVVQRQLQAIVDTFSVYGVDNIGGIAVGNEFILQSYGVDGGGRPTDAAGVAARTQLLQTIQQVNTTIQGLNLGRSIPIGTSDAGSAITPELCEGIDFYQANDHPWFGGVPIGQAAGWTWEFFQENDVAVCGATTRNPHMMIGETGWPTNSLNSSTLGGAVASTANLQTFLDTFVCQANTNQTDYFYFQYSDQPWTRIYGGVEPYWGLFGDMESGGSTRQLKSGITIPNCQVTTPLGGTVAQLKTPSGSASTGNTNARNPSSGASSIYSYTTNGLLILMAGAALIL